MAAPIRGITIQLEGDATPLTQALRQVDRASQGTVNELGQINRALRFDPGNTTLLSQRFEELKTLFATESLERLETLHFVLDAEPKSKTKRKSSPKKKKVNKESEKIEMENQITVEENNEELIVVG